MPTDDEIDEWYSENKSFPCPGIIFSKTNDKCNKQNCPIDYSTLNPNCNIEECQYRTTDCMTTVEEYRAKLINTFHKANHDELIALVALPTEKDFEHLEWLLKTHYGNREKCNDCISRDAALEILDDYTEDIEIGNFGAYTRARISMRKLPSVDPERKTGKWFLLDECANEGWYCDQCHKKVFKADFSNTMRKYKFCPNCGSRMEVEE